MHLPLRNNESNLTNSMSAAEKRQHFLEQKFDENSECKSEYVSFMNNMVAQGYAELVTYANSDKLAWYILHHGVYNFEKKTKLRVALDCSANFQEKSLHDYLLQGPDLTNSLIGVLIVPFTLLEKLYFAEFVHCWCKLRHENIN